MGSRFSGPRPGVGATGTAGQLPPVRYFENGRLREALVDTEAEAEANSLAADNLNKSQIRAYYFEVLSLRRRVEQEIGDQSGQAAEEIFLKHRPQLKMLRAKVHYARARRTIGENMKIFIERHVQAVSSLADFLAFCTHFEAVVAFHRGFADHTRR
jgi:CRISPR type III-A-associated protein Csm2